MTFEQGIFILISLITLGSGLIVVLNRNLFHAALAMMLSFLGVAAMYVTLDAGFLAAAQLLVYIGAISILVIFAIMLTRRLMSATESPFNSQPLLGLFTAVATFAVIAAVIYQFWPVIPDADTIFATSTPLDPALLSGSVVALGESLVSANAYVLPFEIASVLLLAALIGSIVVAWPRNDEEEA